MTASDSPVALDSASITRASGSNLAFAFACLPKQRRRDMTTFYAFCRVVDDIADDPQLDSATKQGRLQTWLDIIERRVAPGDGLSQELLEVLERYESIDPAWLREIVRGMEMDLGVVRYETYEALQAYCYRVASAVGLVSIQIFGARDPQAPAYAIELGHALQMTNIIRDVGEDLREADRIYLPQEDMTRFSVSEADLREGRAGDGFARLMAFQAERAKQRFASAASHFPSADAKALRASELMRRVYQTLLQQMERDGFQVLQKRYRLGALQKLLLLLGSFLAL